MKWQKGRLLSGLCFSPVSHRRVTFLFFLHRNRGSHTLQDFRNNSPAESWEWRNKNSAEVSELLGSNKCPKDLEMAMPKRQDDWSKEDIVQLLESMEKSIPSSDGHTFKTTQSVMDWEKVAFKDFSGEMCKLKWLEVSHKVRKFRTLKELVLEAKENVSNPSKKHKKTAENIRNMLICSRSPWQLTGTFPKWCDPSTSKNTPR